MTDFITVLASSTHRIVKAFSGTDFKQMRFTTGELFDVEEREAHDLDGLIACLKELETETSKAVIRGKLKGTGTSNIPRKADRFGIASRQWCMIDIDSLKWDGDTEDQQAMVCHAVSQLPAEFQGVDCWYHFSSSMGIKSGIRVHLWFWLERPCADDEMKVWLAGCPVDLRLFNPVQIHLTANPRFLDGAVDPYPQRSGLFEAGSGITSVPVPDDLAEWTATQRKVSTQRTRTATGMLDPEVVVRDLETGLAIDGREQLMFLLSNEIASQLITETSNPNEDDLTQALWEKFSEEADLTVVSDRGPWTVEDARVKAKARLKELNDGTYSFVSRSDRTTLVAGSGTAERPTLVSAQEAQDKLSEVLNQYFEDLGQGNCPRTAVRITMGAGKTTETIKHLKAFLADRTRQNIEVYVPRHDLASEWEVNLDEINAKVIHVYPRTGGKWDQDANAYEQPIMCQRADYVRDLEAKGHSIYSKACLSRNSGERCSHFSGCAYLHQFREGFEDSSSINTIRIYSHASLFLNRNEFERDRLPDLVVIDEGFLAAAINDPPSLSTAEIIDHLRTETNGSLGFDLVECISRHRGDIAFLRDRGLTSYDFLSISLEHLNPSTDFNPEAKRSQDVRSVKLYRNLQKLVDQVVKELEDETNHYFEQLAFHADYQKVVICEHKESRVPRSTPVLYLDATADPVVTEPYLPHLEYHRIDVRQLAVVSQVHDRTGSNSFWNEKIPVEEANLAASEYDEGHNDISRLVVVLNAWADAGERPLLVGHMKLCDFLRTHTKLDQRVSIAHFNSLRGTNDYEGNSAIFITGRHQPPFDEFDRQARSVFGTSGYPLIHESYDDMPTEQVEYWLSDRSEQPPSAIALKTFSDPRISAVQRQAREAETLQAIARLRLVWANYQKRVFLLSNMPVEMPVDHLISFGEMMPDKLELEFLRTGNLPLTPRGLEKMRPDLGYTEASARQVFQPDRSKASDPMRLTYALPDMMKASVQIARFKAGDIRKRPQQHLFLPKDFDGEPTATTFTPWSEREVLAYLEEGWELDNVVSLELEFLLQGEPEVSA